jgi:hypothetical protein
VVRNVLKGAGAGAVIAVALGYRRSGGYDAAVVRAQSEALASYHWGRESTITNPLTAIAVLATGGGAFGASIAAITRVLPTPPVITGAAAAVASVFGVNAWYRMLPSAQQRWAVRPGRKELTTIAAVGAAVAVASRTR